MSQNYLITITGGTSPGPYSVYYNTISDSNIALKYLYYTPATGITLSELLLGYVVNVPDNTTIIYLYNTLCNMNQSFPVENPIETYDFCLYISDISIHFNPNGSYGEYPTWISDDLNYSVIWDTTINKWRVIGGTFTYQIVSNSAYPPTSGWYTIGGGQGNLLSSDGDCKTITELSFNTIINQPTCECDGSITFLPEGGIPPYQYSIDNGVTQSLSAIFNNLCDATYSLVLTDSNMNTSYNTIILTKIQTPVTYSLSMSPVVTTITNTPTLKTNQISVTINVTPPLPVGVILTFNINHFNLFKSSPDITTSTQTNNTILTVNGIPQGSPITTTGYSVLNNDTVSGCQDELVFQTNTTDSWNGITISNGDVIILNTTTSVMSSIVDCLIGESYDSYDISNAQIIGCSCCDVIVVNNNQSSIKT